MNKNARKVESLHTHLVSRDTIEDSMEDAAFNAYLYYHGRRFEAMKEDGFRFFPRNGRHLGDKAPRGLRTDPRGTS